MAGLTLISTDVHAEPDGTERIRLLTNGGVIDTRFHPPRGDAPLGGPATLWVFGSGGGLGGPAGGMYTRLSARLALDGVAGLELAYRRPGVLAPCLADVALGLGWLRSEGFGRVVLVGHSFGGAVVIGAGAADASAAGVAALSSQTIGTAAVAGIAPRPLLVAHGEADEILPATCSRDIFARAGEPKRLILYPGCRHGLDACRDALEEDLLAWIGEVLGLRG